MIVKNEAHVIQRCLSSLKNFIDYWVIVDTGSSDGTQDLIRETLQEIPGALFERPWVNFSHNRNEALELAKDKGDFLLLIDADDYLVFSDDFQMPRFTKDLYVIVQKDAATQVETQCLFLVSTRLPWHWEGIAHEALVCSEKTSGALLHGVVNVYGQDGHRSQSPEKHQQVIELLLKEQELHPTDTKPIFYLAETYRGAKNYPEAIAMYRKRAAMGGFEEEIFWSLYSIAKLEGELGASAARCEELYLEAYRQRPSRMEPIYDLILLYRKNNDLIKAYELAKTYFSTPTPPDLIFVSRWVYEWGILWQYAICCQLLGKIEECSQALMVLSQVSSLPPFLQQLTTNG